MIEELNKLSDIVKSLQYKEEETDDTMEKEMLENLREKIENVLSKYNWE